MQAPSDTDLSPVCRKAQRAERRAVFLNYCRGEKIKKQKPTNKFKEVFVHIYQQDLLLVLQMCSNVRNVSNSLPHYKQFILKDV